MAIKNHNIAKDAKIDISKLNRIDGVRTHYTDFDDDDVMSLSSEYGFQTVTDGGEAKSGVINSCGHLQSKGGNRKVILRASNMWSVAKNPKFEVLINSMTRDSQTIFLLIGWTDADGVVNIDAPTTANDIACFMWSSADSANWRFRTNDQTGNTDTQLGTAVATTTSTKLSIELTPAGGVIAYINDTRVAESIGNVATGGTEWVPFVRLHGNTSNDQYIYMDTWCTT